MSFQRAIEAYAGVPDDDDQGDPFSRREYVVPTLWTPYHVAKRLVVAFDILEAITHAPGPQMYGNGWPLMLREYSDLVDEDSLRNHRAEFERAAVRRRLRPTPIEIDMSEEAIGWPGAFLTLGGQEIDALVLWTLSTVKGLNVSRLLMRRRARADAMIEAIYPYANRSSAPITDKARLEGAVAGVLLTANIMLDLARAAAREARSDVSQRNARADAVFARTFALERLRKQVQIEALIARPARVRIKRSEVMPGKVFNQAVYDDRRKLAAQIIAEKLDLLGVTVR